MVITSRNWIFRINILSDNTLPVKHSRASLALNHCLRFTQRGEAGDDHILWYSSHRLAPDIAVHRNNQLFFTALTGRTALEKTIFLTRVYL
jgi:hypothetical protein